MAEECKKRADYSGPDKTGKAQKVLNFVERGGFFYISWSFPPEKVDRFVEFLIKECPEMPKEQSVRLDSRPLRKVHIIPQKIWNNKERKAKADQLNKLSSTYEVFRRESTLIESEIVSKSREIEDIKRQIEHLNRREQEAQVILNEKKDRKENCVKEMQNSKEQIEPLEEQLKEMEERWKANECIVKRGIEVCSQMELRQLLVGEGIEESIIVNLESNKVGGSLLVSLDTDAMKNDLGLGLKERLSLNHIVRSWKKREMVDEEEQWNTEMVIECLDL
eukprot:TRINITY_DN5144_c0_g2_i2.p1 TRINITY_DN5144_c0_g2~~TRINITY_DN5144_c0_g2_i2.p1  ORF type:complete len:277 (+),score=91.32 TRINITY_DN5144_c0_g2_i2:262-1092(+)